MKLLLDQNISFRLVSKIHDTFPESAQVRQLGIEGYSDIDIWNYAKKHSYTIVTFDADFYDISSLKGHPPKIIWLRTGNTTTNFLANLLISKSNIIQSFIESEAYKESACLEIN